MRNLMRISATAIDYFKTLLSEESIEVIKQKMTTYEPSIHMEKGSFLHLIMEKGVKAYENIDEFLRRSAFKKEMEYYINNLQVAGVKELLNYRKNISETALKEQKKVREFKAPEPVKVVGKADLIENGVIVDYKFTSMDNSYLDYHTIYSKKIQHIIYSELFGLDKFKYVIFQMNKDKTEVVDLHEITFNIQDKKPFYEYLQLMVSFINQHNIGYFYER